MSLPTQKLPVLIAAMNTFSVRLVALSALFFPILLTAQTTTYTVSGRALDPEGAPLYLASLTLVNQQDTTLRYSNYSNEDGTFELREVQGGLYQLRTFYLGLEAMALPVRCEGASVLLNLGDLAFKPASKLLNTVTITGKQKFVERKIDRTVVNVDALIGNAGSNALEVLQRSPGVSVDQDGLIRLKDRSGVTVYIDDKPTYLSGADLENYLKSLPAGALKQIEIMTNPPAKYEAAGNSGIINIVTKKNKLSGIYGNVSTSLQQGQYTRSNNSLNLNANRKRLGVTLLLNGGFRETFKDLYINRYYKSADNVLESSFSQNSYIVRGGRSLNGKFGLDFYATEKTTLGFSAKGLVGPSFDRKDNLAFVRDGSNNILQKVIADNSIQNTFDNGTFNAYFKQSIGAKGASLSFDADYVTYNSGADQTFLNYLYTPGDQLEYQDQIDGNLPSNIKIYAAKMDFTQPLGTSAKLEAGLKTAFTATDNTADYRNTIDGVTTPDYNLSNQFLYDEWIHSAYLNYSKSFGKVDLQLGLRGETTQLEGNQLGNPVQPDTSFTRQYSNLFPTVFALWRVDTSGRHVMTFSFGRRINRPFFQDLNPFISPLDKFTFYGGNPNLLPTYAYNFSLAHTFRDWLTTSLNYGLTTDGINETLEIANGIYYSRPGNIATNHSLTLSLEASKPVNTWYTFNTYCEGGYLLYKSRLYTETLDAGGFYHYLSVVNSFTLGKGWSAELHGEYQSDIIYAQLLIKSYGTLNVAFQKKVLKNKGSLKLSVNDILYTRRADGIINNLRLTDADWNSRIDSRQVTATFTYGFGKARSNKPKHNGSGSESEQSRVKS